MSKVLVTQSHLEDIADAIRAKNGGSDTYTPGQMAGAIEALPDAPVLVTKTITANGEYDPGDDNADGYSGVTVNVPSSQPNLQSKTVTENGTVLPDAGYDGLSSVVVNVSGGSGGGVMIGTQPPSANVGSPGDVYLQYIDVSQITARTYEIIIEKGLRGANELIYVGANEIRLIFDDGNGNEVNIADMSNFTHNAKNNNGTTQNDDKLYDGSTTSGYAEFSPTTVTLTLSATVPIGYTAKRLEVHQRTGSYTQDVWKTFSLIDAVSGAVLISKSNLTTNDWAGAGNYTQFSVTGTEPDYVVTHTYVRLGDAQSSVWTETDKIEVVWPGV